VSFSPDFVDAQRIHRTLDAVIAAPELYRVATERFSDLADDGPDVDGRALAYLVDEDFLHIPTELAHEIDRFQHFEEEAERNRAVLQQHYARLRAANLELRRAEAELEKGFFKTKARKWSEESRCDSLRKKVEELEFKRRRLEGDTDRAAGLMQHLLDKIYRDPTLRGARWFGGRPLIVTHHGHFLLDYLSDLNHSHFRGRTLAEIIEVGPSLA